MKPPKILTERTVFRGAIFDVIERQLKLETGQSITRQIVLKHDSVLIILINDSHQLYVQTEYRSGINQVTSGFIAGMIESTETPKAAALREIKEEAGYDINLDDLEYIDTGALSEGFTNEFTYVFVGRVHNDTKQGAQNLDADEYINHGHWVDFQTAADDVSSMAGQMGLKYLANKFDA